MSRGSSRLLCGLLTFCAEDNISTFTPSFIGIKHQNCRVASAARPCVPWTAARPWTALWRRSSLYLVPRVAPLVLGPPSCIGRPRGRIAASPPKQEGFSGTEGFPGFGGADHVGHFDPKRTAHLAGEVGICVELFASFTTLFRFRHNAGQRGEARERGFGGALLDDADTSGPPPTQERIFSGAFRTILSAPFFRRWLLSRHWHVHPPRLAGCTSSCRGIGMQIGTSATIGRDGTNG